MQKFGLFLCFFVLCISVSAQIGGKHTYQFLNLVSSPKQAALGGINITGRTYDPTSAFYNPAIINAEMQNRLAVNYVSYIADVKYGTAAYAFKPFKSLGIFQVGVTYINYGTFNGYDVQGNPTGTFSGGSTAVSIGYAYQIPESKFYVGANVKLITSKLEQYTSSGGAIDLGLTYIDKENRLIIAAVARNIGSQFKPYDEVYESLPFEVDFGISQRVEEIPIRWHVTLQNLQQWDLAFRNTARDKTDLEGNVTPDDPSVFNNFLRHVVLGLELFPEGGFNIRLGFNFRRSEELRIIDQRAFAGLSGGFSIKFNKVRVSYTYARYSAAASSSFFGVNINLGGEKEAASD